MPVLPQVVKLGHNNHKGQVQKIVQEFLGLYPGFLGKGPWPNWEKSCCQNVEIGEKKLTKRIKLEAYSTIMNI